MDDLKQVFGAKIELAVWELMSYAAAGGLFLASLLGHSVDWRGMVGIPTVSSIYEGMPSNSFITTMVAMVCMMVPGIVRNRAKRRAATAART